MTTGHGIKMAANHSIVAVVLKFNDEITGHKGSTDHLHVPKIDTHETQQAKCRIRARSDCPSGRRTLILCRNVVYELYNFLHSGRGTILVFLTLLTLQNYKRNLV